MFPRFTGRQSLFKKTFMHARSSDVRLSKLKIDLGKFYSGNKSYYESAEGGKDSIYATILLELNEKRRSLNRPLRILELGAGRTSFPEFLRKNGWIDIDFVAHDINSANVEFYENNEIDHVIGDWSVIDGRGLFDFCFSTYVFEHLVEPHDFLKGMTRNLTPNGALAIVCPKYVFPGYVPPAIRWMSWRKRHFLTYALAVSNIWAKLSKRPNFWICVEPAVFKIPWHRDYDAVHMVSTSDVKAVLGPNFIVRRLPLYCKTMRWRLFNWLTMLSIIAERRHISK